MANYLDVAANIIVIWVLAAITPGANVLLTMNTALRFKRRLAIWSAFGVSIAVMLWAALGASGLLIVLKTFPWLFTVMKITGGMYLLYLGVTRIIATRRQNGKGLEVSQTLTPLKPVQLFRLSFVTSMINPKTGLFVVSLFSVAMPATMTTELTLMSMALMGGITLVWHLFLVTVFSRPSAQQFYRRASNMIDYLTGGLFTLFGIKVMAS
ncbi:LysE family translocator [Photobacterium sp. OFAV2-7]|uniref:LysE family translocator n=1 Tax=Photobacterium sp. OFAV2-7 TaxID=2917748 RepID=UPI001EF496C2|nr:LysE family transporter [Photobacterium sp. OFAV2-7]MCG7586232.1 LysE family transporter [Photobacterium sp. OFAV2-7]